MLRPAESTPPEFVHAAKPRSDDGSLDSSNNESDGTDGTDDTMHSMGSMGSMSLSSELSAKQSVLPGSPPPRLSLDLKSRLKQLGGSPDSKLNVYIQGSEVKPRKGYRNQELEMVVEAV